MPVLTAACMFLITPATQADTPLTCNMQTFSGEDDVAHQMTLPFNLFLGGVDYNQVYLTTNGTMTFGSPDANYWSYPSTPSVSLAGWDWVTWGQDAYVSYGYNENSFCIEWSVRPFPQSTGDLTQIRLMVNRFNNGNWHGEITTFGWLPPQLRRGIVSEQNGSPLVIEAAFDVIRGVPIEVEPQPQPTSFDAPPQVNCWDGSQADSMDLCPVEPIVTCWDGSVVHYESECPINPTPSPSQSNTILPTPEPTETFQPVEPTPEPAPTSSESLMPSPIPSPSASPSIFQSQPVTPVVVPSPSLTQSSSSPSVVAPVQTESPSLDPSPSSTDSPSNNLTTEQALEQILSEYDNFQAIPLSALEELSLDYSDLPPDQPVMLENGVVLFAEVADALHTFEDIDLFLATVITDPAKLVTAFANVGADMTPEKRKESQQVTISVIIYAQLMNGLSAANMLMRRF